MSYASRYLEEVRRIAGEIDPEAVERLASLLVDLRQQGGRLFFLGVGGSAANAGHAVNDFRKMAGLKAYAPTDNVWGLRARGNAEGWEGVLLGCSRGAGSVRAMRSSCSRWGAETWRRTSVPI